MSPTPPSILRMAPLVLAILAPATAACSSSGSGGDATSAEARTADDVYVGDADLSAVTKVFPDHLEVPLAGHADLLSLPAGEVLVGPPAGNAANPDGFLRKVVSVRADGATIAIATTPAKLTDAVTTGTMGHPATSGDVATLEDPLASKIAAIKNDFSGAVVLASTDSFELSSSKFLVTEKVNVAEGDVAFAPTFDHSLSIEDGELSSLRRGVGGKLTAHLVLDVDVDVDADVAVDGFAEIPEKTKTRIFSAPRIQLPPEFVGVVPVFEALDYGIDLGCDFAFKGPVHTKVGVDFSIDAALGASYADGAWSKVGSLPKVVATPTFEADVAGTVTATCALMPYAEILFYDVLGPSVSFGPSIEAVVEGGPGQDPRWAVYPGFSAAIGGEFDVLGHDVAEASFTIFDWRSKSPIAGSATPPDATP